MGYYMYISMSYKLMVDQLPISKPQTEAHEYTRVAAEGLLLLLGFDRQSRRRQRKI